MQKTAARERIQADYFAGDISGASWEKLSGRLDDELRALDAQIAQLDGRERQARSEADLGDAEQAMLESLAAIRAAIVGDVRDAEDLDAVRAALTRLFHEFVLVSTSEARQHRIIGAKLLNIARGVSELSPDAFDLLTGSCDDDERELFKSLRAFGKAGVKDARANDLFFPNGFVGDAALMSELVGAAGSALVPWVRREVVEGFAEDWAPLLRRVPLSAQANNYRTARAT